MSRRIERPTVPNRGRLSRRALLRGGLITASTLPLAGCFDFLADRDHPARNALESANALTYRAQRLLLGSDGLAVEYSASEIRQGMRPNGSTFPRDPLYRQMAQDDFSDWSLEVGGMVQRPRRFSLDELMAMPARSQITRHDCVEGWSCIAKWTGTPLGGVLDEVGVREGARYVVFQCYDTLGSGSGLFGQPPAYYESIDFLDARHPQTILAYGLNDERLPVSNGAPLRVRIERQLGYKMAKYIRAITVTDTLEGFGEGKGGYWEDRGYEWFAGI